MTGAPGHLSVGRAMAWAVGLAVLLSLGWFALRVSSAYQAITHADPGRELEQTREALFQRLQAQPKPSANQLTALNAAGAPAWGSPKAPLTIVEFLDYDCPFCREADPIMRRLVEQHPDQVRLIVRDFPVEELHPQAEASALAAHCALDEGAYWPYHAQLFAHQDRHGRADYIKAAVNVGLNERTFAQCLDDTAARQAIQQNVVLGVQLGVQGTPTFFFNGVRIPGVIQPDMLEWLVSRFLSI